MNLYRFARVLTYTRMYPVPVNTSLDITVHPDTKSNTYLKNLILTMITKVCCILPGLPWRYYKILANIEPTEALPVERPNAQL